MTLDHYRVLGLPSGDEGAILTEREISRAYKLKALGLHPDKRPDDPNALADFQNLRSSYETLMDPVARRRFDDSLRQLKKKMEAEQTRKFMKRQDGLKRRSDALYSNMDAKRRKQEPAAAKEKNETAWSTSGVDHHDDDTHEKILDVSWEKEKNDYSEEELRKFFFGFGFVRDIYMSGFCSKNKKSATVVMVAADSAVAAARIVAGRLSSPLLVSQYKRIV
ncbi:hypothetical protein Tsubulata_049161 [Turnera subulata]|uniref:J domain-containing protein n=1 Tax=Turnera subulata TaxID=218843 RepID=A0A9Q0GER9_9ROSI|nr:hypothetical protein Tsubulata_049161 [Turnera subulata]